MAGEVAWLVEFKPSFCRTPTYWGRTTDTDGGVLGMTEDHLAALRFARKQDAELFIEDVGWTDAMAVEHMWCDAPSKS